MTKIIIQPGKYRGLYQIILLQCRRFFLIQWWKPVSIVEYHEEEAVLKLGELVKKYNIPVCNIYDWSVNEFSPTFHNLEPKTQNARPAVQNLQLVTE